MRTHRALFGLMSIAAVHFFAVAGCGDDDSPPTDAGPPPSDRVMPGPDARPDGAEASIPPADARTETSTPPTDAPVEAGEGDTAVPDSSTTMTISSPGGTVSIPGARVDVPAGAVTMPTAVGVAAAAAPTPIPAEFEAASLVYAFTPHGQTFNAAVRITLEYTGAADTVLRLDDAADTSWETVAGPLFAAPNASFDTTRFSFYIVARRAAMTTAVAPLYPAAATWNSWVLADGTDAYSATGAVCDQTTSASNATFLQCLHGGEMRAVAATGRASCAGLTASDALDAFDWRCVVRGGTATFVSRLKASTKTADLIDFAALAWRPNSVAILDGATNVRTTPNEAWWTNPIVRDDDGGSLSTTGTVYVARAAPMVGYFTAQPQVTLIVEPGVELGGLQAGEAQAVNSNHFAAWIEGDFDSRGMDRRAIALSATQQVVRHVRVRNGASTTGLIGLFTPQQGRTMIEHVRLACASAEAGALGIGLEFGSRGGNVLRDVRVDRCQTGIQVAGAFNILDRITVGSNGGRGISLPGGQIATDIVVANNGTEGIAVDNASLVSYATASNNLGAGAEAVGSATATTQLISVATNENRLAGVSVRGSVRFFDLATFANTHFGIVTPFTSSGASFHGSLGIRYNGGRSGYYATMPMCFMPAQAATMNAGDCSGFRTSMVSGMPNGLLNVQDMTYPGCMIDTTNSTATGISIELYGTSSPYPMRVTDAVNTSDDPDGRGAPGAITDWNSFESPYRVWGAGGSGTPHCNAQGPCLPTSAGPVGCQIRDYSLRTNTTVLRRSSALPLPLGNDVHTHDFVVGFGTPIRPTNCATLFEDATFMMTTGPDDGYCRVRFLRYARELSGDQLGNENTLCESGETCVWAPNIGAYQGHGPLVAPVGYTFTNGMIRDVTLLRHETIGVANPYMP